MAFEKKVGLVAWLQNPEIEWSAEDSAACGAWGCFSEKDSRNIHEEERAKPAEEQLADKDKIFKETSGRGHGAVLDHGQFVFSIDNLTRASTLTLCAPQYASHLQQSLRRATAERGFHLPKELEDTSAKELMERQFVLYDKMKDSKEVPGEDARYILPLATKTAIQTSIDPRELMHLHSMTNHIGVPAEVRDTISQMVSLAAEKAPRLMADRKENYNILAWMPSSQLFAPTNKTIEDLISDWNYPKTSLVNHAGIKMNSENVKRAVENRDETELANLKHYHFTFLAPMSLASFHQATRQRTWDQSIQTLHDAVLDGHYVTPPSVARSTFAEEYTSLNKESLRFAMSRFHANYPEVLMVVPHSLQVYDLIHVNGWNAIHSIGKRTCTEAQWEIRGVAQAMAELIRTVSPELGQYAVPQGKIYGKCPERKSCGLCDKK